MSVAAPLAVGLLAPTLAGAQTITNTRTGVTFPTFATAIPASVAGDTLQLSGPVTEAFTVDRDLTITGLSGAQISSGSATILTLTAGRTLTVDGVNFVGTANTRAIEAAGGANTITVRNATIRTGTAAAAAQGGGLRVINPTLVTLENIVFDGDTGRIWAQLGGALYVDAVAVAPVNLTNVTFDRVTTTSNGAGVWARNVAVTCIGCSFDHTDGAFGGGIFATNGTLVVEQSLFCASDGGLGGAVFSTATTDIRSSRFVESHSASNGGALYLNGGSWTIRNNHFVGVTGSNTIFRSSLAAVTGITNNLFLSNAGTAYRNSGAVPPINFNWFFDNVTNSNAALPATNITTGGDPHLTLWTENSDCSDDLLYPEPLVSPLIDAGDPAIADLDGSRSDIGAFGGPNADPFFLQDNDGDGATFFLDCDDTEPAAFPGNDEFCDGIDNDCDGSIDEDPVDLLTFYVDCDLDDHGVTAGSVTQCFEPAALPSCGGQWVTGFSDDCNDADPAVHPGAAETCAPGDLNCDGDDLLGAEDAVIYFEDFDGDGVGAHAYLSCEPTPPPGSVTVGGDCFDSNASVFPGAFDVCGDGIDQNCDLVDGDVGALIAWYPDLDADTFGDGTVDPVLDCRPGAGIGYVADDTDCDDSDPTVHPGAPETCDGRDEDCNGLSDDLNAPIDWFVDADGDGFGDDATVVNSDCAPGAGYVTLGGDCDDADPLVNPSAEEVCNGFDDDCNGTIDDTGVPVAWFADGDGDGFGDPSKVTVADCSPGAGYVTDGNDCDDTDPLVNPDAVDACDGIDNDCDGLVDDGGAVVTWYQDVDADGYGDDTVTLDDNCPPDETWTLIGGDCVDTDPTIHPDAVEVCDGIDQDCDGTVDDTGAAVTWLTDADADGFGDDATAVIADCPPSPDAVTIGGDCDDTDPTVNPGAVEVCDGIDQDCDGTVDNTGDPQSWYFDADGDGFGGDTSTLADCSPGDGWTQVPGDCRDIDAGVYPGAPELCDGIDQDCDGVADDVGSPVDWFVDADADGFGDDATAVSADCSPGAGYVTLGGDCDDTDAAVHPGATEACDGRDEDCDGLVDNTGAGSVWYHDGDGDGFGDPADTVVADCPPGGGYLPTDGDCDDADAAVHPGATESCDGIDNDCDGTVDDLGTDPVTWSFDADGDGFAGAATSQVAFCSPGVGWYPSADDCDDADAAVHPGATETCDGRDEDCDTVVDDVDGAPVTWYVDADADGYGDGGMSTTQVCSPGDGWTDVDGDCDDTDPVVNPDGGETCDGRDEDCNGIVDDLPTPASTWYFDADADGYGDPGTAVVSYCSPGSGYIPSDGDCDDADGGIHPGAPETCDSVDQDCNGIADDIGSPVTWYLDYDGDGYGSDMSATVADCPPGPDWVLVGGDCNDTDPTKWVKCKPPTCSTATPAGGWLGLAVLAGTLVLRRSRRR
ncbi:MAG: putative metal-binding motif-containing protein [Myxococcota bacterium]